MSPLVAAGESSASPAAATRMALSSSSGSAPLPRKPEARIIGRADDEDSLECLVVELDGTTDRPDGSTYHITWSLGPGRKARESNDVLRDGGWQHLPAPIDVTLEPARF